MLIEKLKRLSSGASIDDILLNLEIHEINDKKEKIVTEFIKLAKNRGDKFNELEL